MSDLPVTDWAAKGLRVGLEGWARMLSADPGCVWGLHEVRLGLEYDGENDRCLLQASGCTRPGEEVRVELSLPALDWFTVTAYVQRARDLLLAAATFRRCGCAS